jgi:hypothetical protein
VAECRERRALAKPQSTQSRAVFLRQEERSFDVLLRSEFRAQLPEKGHVLGIRNHSENFRRRWDGYPAGKALAGA